MSDWVPPVTTGLFTLIAGLGGVELTQRSTRRRERERYQQETRMSSYAGLLVAVEKARTAAPKMRSVDPKTSLQAALFREAEQHFPPGRYVDRDWSEVHAAHVGLYVSVAQVQLVGSRPAVETALEIRSRFDDWVKSQHSEEASKKLESVINQFAEKVLGET